MSIDEVLNGPKRSCVLVSKTFNQLELRAQGASQFLDIVSFNIESAASEWAIRECKSCDDKMPVRFQSTSKILDITITIIGIG
jgi:hypothetical protein